MRGSLLLFLFAFGLGFVAAIPVGGSQIEMAKRAIGGHLRSAGMVVLGSASSDVIYGVVALFALAPFMETPWVLASFNVVGALLLWTLAVLTLKQSRRRRGFGMRRRTLASGRRAYVTGFSLAASNPPMILSWLLGAALATRLGIATPFTARTRILFVAGGALGLGSYLGILAVVMYRIKRFIPKRALGRVYFWLGVALFALSFYFVYGALKYFLTGR